MVNAPQFSLPDGPIHSVYPPPGYSDDHRILPHVVLTDPHLPWERLGSPKSAALAAAAKTDEPPRNRVPWLVVFSFSQEELRLPVEDLDGPQSIFRHTSPGVVKPVKQSSTMTVNMSIADLWVTAPPNSADVTTPIDLCLALFPWAAFRQHKAAIKLHTLLSLQGNFPTVIIVSTGSVHDVNILDQLVWEAGSFYIMDRGYLDFARWHRIHQCGAFFVTRASKLPLRPPLLPALDKTTGLRFDQTVVLTGLEAQRDYPDPLRRIGYRDPITGKSLVFLTNNFTVSALTITQLYRDRWQIELFFKWIKQHLRIKAFYGTSPNAVRTQVWTAIAVYLLVAILKKRLHLDASLYTILQILSLTLFEKMPISQALAQLPPPSTSPDADNHQCLLGF